MELFALRWCVSSCQCILVSSVPWRLEKEYRPLSAGTAGLISGACVCCLCCLVRPAVDLRAKPQRGHPAICGGLIRVLKGPEPAASRVALQAAHVLVRRLDLCWGSLGLGVDFAGGAFLWAGLGLGPVAFAAWGDSRGHASDRLFNAAFSNTANLNRRTAVLFKVGRDSSTTRWG